MILSLGVIGTFLLNNFLRDTYTVKKSELERRVGNFLNKKVSLGEYSGIRFLGFSLGNSKIIDKKNLDSGIKSKNKNFICRYYCVLRIFRHLFIK